MNGTDANFVDHAKPRGLANAQNQGDSLLDIYGSSKAVPIKDSLKRTGAPEDESSKWIHRDKLARIENEELQAAGIILPRPRARSKPPMSHANGNRRPIDGEGGSRSRKNSSATLESRTPEIVVPSWDLRLPDEVAADTDGYFVLNDGARGTSRLPVAKQSPLPVPIEHIERDMLMARRRDDSPDAEDKLSYPKTRSRRGSENALESSSFAPQPAKRSATDISPKKASTSARKSSAPVKSAGTSRPGTRNGPGKDSKGNGTRPTTRSGERELSPTAAGKQPEGDPPWMVSAYKPDPRLPPDQQLLPTVAKRLQQEKWEREGKFVSVYDRDFRPLSGEGGFLQPPEAPAKKPEDKSEQENHQDEWPLKAEPPKSPALSVGRTGSYSTIPKIQEKPIVSPMPSPRVPIGPVPHSPVPRVPEAPEKKDAENKSKAGCGCCIVM